MLKEDIQISILNKQCIFQIKTKIIKNTNQKLYRIINPHHLKEELLKNKVIQL